MTLPDYLTLGLSSVAFVFSIVTFLFNTYEQYLKAAKLQLVLGSQMRLGYLGGNTKLGFWVPVALSNQGAVDAVVLRIEGDIAGPGDAKAEVEWYTVGDYDGATNQFVPKGWTDTLIVSSRKATTTWIGLRTTTDVSEPVPEGVYTLTLKVYAPISARWARRASQTGHQRPATTWTGKLTLQSERVVTVPTAGTTDRGFDLGGAQLAHLTGVTRQSFTSTVLGVEDLLDD